MMRRVDNPMEKFDLSSVRVLISGGECEKTRGRVFTFDMFRYLVKNEGPVFSKKLS